MRELRQGLWHWQAPHPQWESAEPWDPNVSSYAIDVGARLLLLALPVEHVLATHGTPTDRTALERALSPS